MNRRRTVGLLVFALTVSACIGPSLDEFVQAADSLAIPADWVLLEEETKGRFCSNPVESCPSVDRIYRVPAETPFGPVTAQVLEGGGFTVWDPASDRCTPVLEKGCNVSARRDDVSAVAIVLDIEPASYTVTIRVGQYAGP